MVIEAGFTHADPIGFLNQARDCDEQDPGQLLTQPTRCFVTIHIGHRDIDQSRVGLIFERRLDASVPVISRPDLVAGISQKSGERIRHVVVVVNHQQLSASYRGMGRPIGRNGCCRRVH